MNQPKIFPMIEASAAAGAAGCGCCSALTSLATGIGAGCCGVMPLTTASGRGAAGSDDPGCAFCSSSVGSVIRL